MEAALVAILERPIYAQGADLLRLWGCWDLNSRFPYPQAIFTTTLVSISPAQPRAAFLSLVDAESLQSAAVQIRSICSVTPSKCLRLSGKLKKNDLKAINELFRPSDAILTKAAAFSAEIFPTVTQSLSKASARALLFPHMVKMLDLVKSRLKSLDRDLDTVVRSDKFQALLLSLSHPRYFLWGDTIGFFDQAIASNLSCTEADDIDSAVSAALRLLPGSNDGLIELAASNALPPPRRASIMLTYFRVSSPLPKGEITRFLNQLSSFQFSKSEYDKMVALTHILSGDTIDRFCIGFHLLSSVDPAIASLCAAFFLLHGGEPQRIGQTNIHEALCATLVRVLHYWEPNSEVVADLLSLTNSAVRQELLANKTLLSEWGAQKLKKLKSAPSFRHPTMSSTGGWNRPSKAALGVAATAATALMAYIAFKRMTK